MKFFLSGLCLLFIGLKMTDVIDWSWWLVLLPLYGGLATFIIVLAACSAVVIIRKIF